jgi:predicted metalloprotease
MQPYPFAHQPHPQANQRPRVASAVTALVLVVALGVIGVAIGSPETVRSAFAPNPVSTLPGGGTTASSTKKTTASPTSGPWIPQPSTTRTTRTTTTPSILPTPTGEQSLSGNPIYQAGGMAQQVCAPPGWPSDGPSGEAFYMAALPCVERAWQPLFERTKLEYDDPTVLVPTGTTSTSPCGTVSTTDASAFYCSANQTIYMTIRGITADWTGGDPLDYLSLFAHEFGHHVQHLTGTTKEQNRRERQAGPKSPAGLELRRRSELQVQCYSGMFIQSIIDSGGPYTRADFDAARTFNFSYRSSPTHGTSDNHGQWWVRGTGNQIATCHTWSAPSAEVA